MSTDNQQFSVGNAYKVELVDVFVDETLIQVWTKNHLIKTVARIRSGPVRNVRSLAYTSNINRRWEVKHQPEFDRGTKKVV